MNPPARNKATSVMVKENPGGTVSRVRVDLHQVPALIRQGFHEEQRLDADGNEIDTGLVEAETRDRYYGDGYRAFRSGHIVANPHEPGTPRYRWWHDGYTARALEVAEERGGQTTGHPDDSVGLLAEQARQLGAKQASRLDEARAENEGLRAGLAEARDAIEQLKAELMSALTAKAESKPKDAPKAETKPKADKPDAKPAK